MSKIAANTILGMGNPLLDISAKVDDDYLKKYGLEPRNAILAEEKHMPIYQEIIAKGGVEYIAGGATQNSIRVAQWALGVPQATTYIGCVGDDEYGKQLKKCASDDGVRTEYMVDASTPTGTCAVLVTDTDRSLVAHLGAANNYKEDHVHDGANWALVEGAKFYYIGGFFLTVSVPSILAVAKHAAEQDKVFCMNLSAPFIPQFFKEAIDQVTPFWDIVFGNRVEALAFAKSQSWETEDLKEIALKTYNLEKKNSKRQRLVVYTQSAEPAVVVEDGVVTEYPVPAVPKAEIVDTNAAGDSFVGGFLSQYVQGKPVAECVRVGHHCAGLVIRRSGCTLPAEPLSV